MSSLVEYIYGDFMVFLDSYMIGAIGFHRNPVKLSGK